MGAWVWEIRRGREERAEWLTEQHRDGVMWMDLGRE